MNVVKENLKRGDRDMLFVSSISGHLTDYWILDSTCSYHMKPNKDQLDTHKLINSSFVLMSNNDPRKVFLIRNQN